MKKSRKKRLRRLAERVVDRHRRRQQQGEVSGVIRMTVSGFGFVTPDSEKFPDIDGDIFIPAKFVNGAIDGDQVQVSLLPPRRGRPEDAAKGPSGKVIAILERERQEFVGELLAGSVLRPLDPRLPDDFILTGSRKGAKRGDWVRVKFDEDGEHSGHIVGVIGKAGVVASDLDAVMAEFDLPPEYTEKEENIALQLEPREIERLDCTDRFVLTIDPADAKDFDDALSLEPSDVKDCIVLGVDVLNFSIGCFFGAQYFPTLGVVVIKTEDYLALNVNVLISHIAVSHIVILSAL